LVLVKMILHQMEILLQTAAKDCCLVLTNATMKFVCVIMIQIINK
jgi:hypothetical protein